MAFLLKMLSDMLQSPQLVSHIHIWPKPKVKLGPTETFCPAPLSSVDIAIATNPSHFGLTDRDLGLTEMGLQTLCFPSVMFRSHQNERISPTEFAWPTLWLAYYQNRSHRVCVIGLTEIMLCPNPNHIGPTDLHVGPTENPNGH